MQGQVLAHTRVAFGQELPTLPLLTSTFIMTYLTYRAAANTLNSAFHAMQAVKVCQDSARVVWLYVTSLQGQCDAASCISLDVTTSQRVVGLLLWGAVAGGRKACC